MHCYIETIVQSIYVYVFNVPYPIKSFQFLNKRRKQSNDMMYIAFLSYLFFWLN